VTKNREPLLDGNYGIFHESLTKLQTDLDFEVVAWVLLPEHVHMVIDPKDVGLSRLMKRLKLSFSYQYRQKIGLYRGHVWQSRFWDHIIRDQEDMNRHIDYIHYNPVKHGHVADPLDWEHSSLRDYFERRFYSRDWGVNEELKFEGSFGE
jgi:putative transposase